MGAIQETSNIIKVCTILSEDHNLRVSVQECTKGALIAGGGAFCGGLVGGPVGMAVGGAVGAAFGAYNAKQFKSLASVIKGLKPQQKQKLVENVQNCLNGVTAADFITLLTLIRSNASLQEIILTEIGKFVMDEFGKAMIK